MQSGPALLHSNHQGQLSHSVQSKDVTIFPTPGMLQVRGETGSCSHATTATSPTLPRWFWGPVLLHPCHQADCPALLRGGEKPALLCVCVSWCGVGPALLLTGHLGQLSSAPSFPFLTTKASFLNNSKQGVGPALLSLHHLASDKGQRQCSNKAHQ